MMRSFYATGNPTVTIYTKSRKPARSDRQTIQAIRKSSGAPIRVRLFVDESMQHISSVLASSASAVVRPPRLGDDYILYPNLSCTDRWTEGSIPLGREWLFEENENGWIGKKLQHIV